MREHTWSGTEIVDGLRGVAILWVLCYHTWLFSWYTPAWHPFGIAVPVDLFPRVGYLGVDLFFVISGFCLFMPGARRAVGGVPEPGLRSFSLRRVVKIVPSYALVVFATIPFALPYLGSQRGVWVALATHFAFLNSFYVDPFGQANSVFWSLAIEVQFYVLFPALAWVFRRAPLPAALGMIATALAYRIHFSGCCLQNEIVVRELPAFLDVFACGMLAAYCVTWGQRHVARLKNYGALMSLGTVVVAVAAYFVLQTCNAVQYVPHGREAWDIYGRAAFGGLCGAFIVCACFAGRRLRAAIANPVLVFLSLVSYNLYLWHTLVMIWMWKHGVPRAATPDPHADDHWKFSYIVLGWSASFAIATAVTYFIERPLLGTIKPHTFAFDWPRFVRRFNVRREPPISTPETRT